MNQPADLKTLELINMLRRSIRVLRRVEEVVTEVDLKKKFDRFVEEHTVFLNELKDLVDLEMQGIQNTPEALIQFPISREELLEIAAKTEKQAVEDVNKAIAAQISTEATKILQKHQSTLIASYDYIQALHDLIV